MEQPPLLQSSQALSKQRLGVHSKAQEGSQASLCTDHPLEVEAHLEEVQDHLEEAAAHQEEEAHPLPQQQQQQPPQQPAGGQASMGALRGRAPDPYDGTRGMAEVFLQKFNNYRNTNYTNETMQVPFQRDNLLRPQRALADSGVSDEAKRA